MQINGKTVDLNKIKPFTMGDYKAMYEQGVSRRDLEKFEELEADKICVIVHKLLSNIDSSIMPDDVDTLTPDDIATVIGAIGKAEKQEEIDSPS